MAQIEVIREEEIPQGGWLFHVQILDEAGAIRHCRVRLSWADYNHWSAGGSDAPAGVAEAVIAFMIARQPLEDLPECFDASIARRLAPDADSAIPQLIRDG